MAKNQKRNWLIGYDITSSRRLNRVRHQIIKEALPVQYSLYLYHGSQDELIQLLDRLTKIIDITQDDIRAYPIPSKAEINLIGSQGLPSSVIYVDQNLGELSKILRHNTRAPHP